MVWQFKTVLYPYASKCWMRKLQDAMARMYFDIIYPSYKLVTLPSQNHPSLTNRCKRRTPTFSYLQHITGIKRC